MSDYTSLSQLLINTQEVLVIDILEHVLAIDEDPYLTSLLPPPAGIYLTGGVEPIIRFDKKYYPKSKIGMRGADIKSLEDMLKTDEDIVDDNGKLVLNLRDIKLKTKHFKLEPTVPAMAIKLAIGLVLKYLNNLCPHTNVGNINYHPNNFVRAKRVDLLFNEKYEGVFEKLLDQVFQFVGPDIWNIYFYKVRGTTLIVEKMLDYRIYDWYKNKFEKEEEKREQEEAALNR